MVGWAASAFSKSDRRQLLLSCLPLLQSKNNNNNNFEIVCYTLEGSVWSGVGRDISGMGVSRDQDCLYSLFLTGI